MNKINKLMKNTAFDAASQCTTQPAQMTYYK